MANTQVKAKATQYSATVLDKDALDAVITSLQNRGKKFDKDVHDAAVSVLHQAHVHKNTGPAMRLLDAMPQSSRKGALRKWLMHFGPLHVKEDGKTLGIDAAKLKPWDKVQGEISGLPFWKFSPDVEELAQVSAMDQIRKLYAKLSKLKEQGKISEAEFSVIEEASSEHQGGMARPAGPLLRKASPANKARPSAGQRVFWLWVMSW